MDVDVEQSATDLTVTDQGDSRDLNASSAVHLPLVDSDIFLGFCEESKVS